MMNLIKFAKIQFPIQTFQSVLILSSLFAVGCSPFAPLESTAVNSTNPSTTSSVDVPTLPVDPKASFCSADSVVCVAYQTFLKRLPDQFSAVYWHSQLTLGLSTEKKVTEAIQNSAEARMVEQQAKGNISGANALRSQVAASKQQAIKMASTLGLNRNADCSGNVSCTSTLSAQQLSNIDSQAAPIMTSDQLATLIPEIFYNIEPGPDYKANLKNLLEKGSSGSLADYFMMFTYGDTINHANAPSDMDGFIKYVYNRVLLRNPSEAEVQNWINLNKAEVWMNVVDLPEFRNLFPSLYACTATLFVCQAYITALHRIPTLYEGTYFHNKTRSLRRDSIKPYIDAIQNGLEAQLILKEAAGNQSVADLLRSQIGPMQQTSASVANTLGLDPNGICTGANACGERGLRMIESQMPESDVIFWGLFPGLPQ